MLKNAGDARLEARSPSVQSRRRASLARILAWFLRRAGEFRAAASCEAAHGGRGSVQHGLAQTRREETPIARDSDGIPQSGEILNRVFPRNDEIGGRARPNAAQVAPTQCLSCCGRSCSDCRPVVEAAFLVQGHLDVHGTERVRVYAGI